MVEIICPYETHRKKEANEIIINCRSCDSGSSTIFDETCRVNIFKILQKERGIDQIVLNHALVKVFRGEELKILVKLADYIDKIKSYQNIQTEGKEFPECKYCLKERTEDLKQIVKIRQRFYAVTVASLRANP